MLITLSKNLNKTRQSKDDLLFLKGTDCFQKPFNTYLGMPSQVLDPDFSRCSAGRILLDLNRRSGSLQHLLSEATSENVILRQEVNPLPDLANSRMSLLCTSGLSLSVQV